MDRRDFIKATGTVVAAETIASVLPPIDAAAQDAAPGRMTLPINRNWRYCAKTSAAAHEREFDDSSFARIVVPHTNIRVPWHSFDERSYEFVSIYRRRFRTPPGARGRRVFVDFEGVMTASTVWINGVLLGEYKGGFTPFSFELTQHLDFDHNNVLAVEVDSTERPDIPPFGYEVDYLTFGGIYREVSLRIVSPTFIENIFAQPRDVLSAHPTLDVQCFLNRGTVAEQRASTGRLTIEAALYDGDRLLRKTSQDVSAPASGEATSVQTLHLENLGTIQL